MTDPRPLLVFDSGVGGLSVLAHIRALLPNAPIIYAADNGGYPYGTKSEAEIAARVPALLGRLVERYRPRLVVIACNTASTIALAHVRSALDLPVVGTVPAIKPAALASRTRVIGVLGTEATVRQAYVDRLIAEFAADCLVVRHGSAELVDMAEAKLRGTPPDPERMMMIMNALFGQVGGDRIDQVTLSCTHFPLLADEIGAASPPHVTLVDSGAGIARRTAHLTQGDSWPEATPGIAVFTRDDPALSLLSSVLATYGLSEMQIL
ncbi:MAG: glutamate racemase [Sphingomonadaceae bacterium]